MRDETGTKAIKFSAYQNRIEECEGYVVKLKEEIIVHDEQAAKLNRQFIINKDNIERWVAILFK